MKTTTLWTYVGLVAAPILCICVCQKTSAQAPEPSGAGTPGVAGRYLALNAQALAAGADRPVGIGTIMDTAAIYPERYVVITREKVALLSIGGAMTVAVPLRDADRPRLGGNYELFVRVERIQKILCSNIRRGRCTE